MGGHLATEFAHTHHCSDHTFMPVARAQRIIEMNRKRLAQAVILNLIAVAFCPISQFFLL
jgi:hypothetical protein